MFEDAPPEDMPQEPLPQGSMPDGQPSPALDAIIGALPQVMADLEGEGLPKGSPEFNKALTERLGHMGFAIKDPAFMAQILQAVGGGEPPMTMGGGEPPMDPMQMGISEEQVPQQMSQGMQLPSGMGGGGPEGF